MDAEIDLVSHFWTDRLDGGIRPAVVVLFEAGVETFESCEGGDDHLENPGGKHAYPEPTVRFHGDEGAGWHALSVLIALNFPVASLRRIWTCYGGIPTGPSWEVTFTRRLDEREERAPGVTFLPNAYSQVIEETPNV